MGMLAVEGSYDKMEALLSQNIHPVDILLMMSASEGDKPKIEELLRAGASYTVKDADGRTALDKAASEEIKDLILGFSSQKAWSWALAGTMSFFVVIFLPSEILNSEMIGPPICIILCIFIYQVFFVSWLNSICQGCFGS